jgi:divalent metal cation (Fe/Co/Zn/Cd) transporter
MLPRGPALLTVATGTVSFAEVTAASSSVTQVDMALVLPTAVALCSNSICRMRAPASYPAEVRGLTKTRRLGLAATATIIFLVALTISWTEGADHLTLQLLAMVLALLAFLLAAFAARSDGRPSQ